MKQRKRLLLLTLMISVCVICPCLLISCSKTESADCNAVTSVMLDKDGTILIEGKLTNGFLSGYSEDKIYLFELPSYCSTAADLTQLSPIAEIKPSGEVSIRISLYDGARSRLFSSFLLASYHSATKTYGALTTPVAISNPQILADRSPVESDSEVSMKGLITDQTGDALQLGIAHTLVDVDLAQLILRDWQEGAVSYVYGGTTAYLNREYLTKLQKTVELYTRHGVRVYLRFVLGAPTDNTPLELYAAANPQDTGKTSFSVNMSDPNSARMMEGVLDYIADQFADPEDGYIPVTAFVMGYRVNDPVEGSFSDHRTLSAYVTNYEKLVRVADCAIKSHNPDGRVYISVDHHRSAATMSDGWDVTTFLSAFRDECTLRGNYDWQVAGELLAPSSSIWEEKPAVDTSFYTVHSLSTLTDLLGSEAYATPEGERRGLLITGFEIPATGEDGHISEDSLERQAASYAYAYMVCLQNGRVEALLYSAYADRTEIGGQNGLRGVALQEDGTLIYREKRPVYNVFKLMDTTKATELSARLSEVIGSAYGKLEASLVGRPSPVTPVSGTGNVLSLGAVQKNTAQLYGFNDGSYHGFENAGGLTYLALKEAESLRNYDAYLYGRFDRDQTGTPQGMTVVIPAERLIGGEQILLDLFAGQIGSSEHTQNTTVTLRFMRPSHGAVSEGEGVILYESSVEQVSGGHWQTVSFDVTSFTQLLDREDTVILTVFVDSPDGIAHEMGIAGVYVTGDTIGSATPIGPIITVVIIMILLVVGVFLLIFLRNRDKKREE